MKNGLLGAALLAIGQNLVAGEVKFSVDHRKSFFNNDEEVYVTYKFPSDVEEKYTKVKKMFIHLPEGYSLPTNESLPICRAVSSLSKNDNEFTYKENDGLKVKCVRREESADNIVLEATMADGSTFPSSQITLAVNVHTPTVEAIRNIPPSAQQWVIEMQLPNSHVITHTSPDNIVQQEGCVHTTPQAISICSANCGGGYRLIERSVLFGSPDDCQPLRTWERCNNFPCEADCTLEAEWQVTIPCTMLCGANDENAQQLLTRRVVVSPTEGGLQCNAVYPEFDENLRMAWKHGPCPAEYRKPCQVATAAERTIPFLNEKGEANSPSGSLTTVDALRTYRNMGIKLSPADASRLEAALKNGDGADAGLTLADRVVASSIADSGFVPDDASVKSDAAHASIVSFSQVDESVNGYTTLGCGEASDWTTLSALDPSSLRPWKNSCSAPCGGDARRIRMKAVQKGVPEGAACSSDHPQIAGRFDEEACAARECENLEIYLGDRSSGSATSVDLYFTSHINKAKYFTLRAPPGYKFGKTQTTCDMGLVQSHTLGSDHAIVKCEIDKVANHVIMQLGTAVPGTPKRKGAKGMQVPHHLKLAVELPDAETTDIAARGVWTLTVQDENESDREMITLSAVQFDQIVTSPLKVEADAAQQVQEIRKSKPYFGLTGDESINKFAASDCKAVLRPRPDQCVTYCPANDSAATIDVLPDFIDSNNRLCDVPQTMRIIQQKVTAKCDEVCSNYLLKGTPRSSNDPKKAKVVTVEYVVHDNGSKEVLQQSVREVDQEQLEKDVAEKKKFEAAFIEEAVEVRTFERATAKLADEEVIFVDLSDMRRV